MNDALASLNAEFDARHTDFGRPSIAPVQLIRASLLQMLLSMRSEPQLMEQVDQNLLLRWFVGLAIDDPVSVPTVFTRNRGRLLTKNMSRKGMAAILTHPEVRRLLSGDHPAVNGTPPRGECHWLGIGGLLDRRPQDEQATQKMPQFSRPFSACGLVIEIPSPLFSRYLTSERA